MVAVDVAAMDGANVGKTSISKDSDPPTTNGTTAPPSGNLANKQIEHVVYSDIGINVLLAKLKQSIASARDFSAFLKRRSGLEEEHSTGLRKLSRLTNESTNRLEARQGSYAQNLASVTQLYERMADNGMEFARSLHQMHEDLTDLANNMDRSRKHWKQEGLSNEKRVKDAESAMEKAKVRYDNSADSYDRVRTGDTGGRTFGIKGPKSAEQREEDLLRKAQTADQDYKGKVEAAQLARKENQDSLRPAAVKQLQELIRECDSGVVLQLQKFAALNERLVVGNGMVVSPLNDLADGKMTTPSMREMVQGIDNDKDFHVYVTSHTSQVPSRPSEVKYEKHSAFGGAPATSPTSTRPRGASQTATSTTSTQPASRTQPSPTTAQPPPLSQSSPVSTVSNRQPSIPLGGMNTPTAPSAPPSATMGPLSASPTSSTPPGSGFQPERQQTSPPDRSLRGPPSGSQHPNTSNPRAQPNPQKPPISAPYPQQSPSPFRPVGAPPTGPPGNAWNDARHQQGPVQPGQYKHPPRGASAAANGAANIGTNIPNANSPSSAANSPASYLQPYNRVFGMTLDELFRRDESAVPLVVYQCIQAVDLFGLDTEGIYRTSGNASHIAQLRARFDHDATKIDFRDPENFFHDVNSVAGLLKMFFRDLADPLFTEERYAEFIEAARIDDPTTRRDSLHAIINALPDPNYATIRAITLHLWRVQEHGDNNRMNVQSLAICFAPTMMGGAKGLGQGADTAFQARVLQTVLENTFMIFDED